MRRQCAICRAVAQWRDSRKKERENEALRDGRGEVRKKRGDKEKRSSATKFRGDFSSTTEGESSL